MMQRIAAVVAAVAACGECATITGEWLRCAVLVCALTVALWRWRDVVIDEGRGLLGLD